MKNKKANSALMLQTSSMGQNLNMEMKAELLKMMKVVSTKKHNRLMNNRNNKKQNNHKKNNKHNMLTNKHKKQNFQSKQMRHNKETQVQ